MQNHLTIILIYFWCRRLTPPTQIVEKPSRKLTSRCPSLWRHRWRHCYEWYLKRKQNVQTGPLRSFKMIRSLSGAVERFENWSKSRKIRKMLLYFMTSSMTSSSSVMYQIKAWYKNRSPLKFRIDLTTRWR